MSDIETFDKYMCAALTGLIASQKAADVLNWEQHLNYAIRAAQQTFMARENAYNIVQNALNPQPQYQAYAQTPQGYPQLPGAQRSTGPQVIGNHEGKPITVKFAPAPSGCLICGNPVMGPPKAGYETNADCMQIHRQ